MEKKRDECRAAHTEFAKACGSEGHGMRPTYNPGGAAPRLGSGARFKALSASLAKKGASNPRALAAWIGRKKYGAKKFAALGAAGRRRGT